MVVCAVGLGDGQDLLLTRVGMKAATCAAPANSDDFNDDVRVMYCVGADCLNTSFRRLMGESSLSALLVEQDTARSAGEFRVAALRDDFALRPRS